ncbi:MAG: MBL fold metallo-hydrolase [Alphaproteobacteria bacterium]|nr:MBL fold metallo-hydrolase [Alphaproteobacteria bacterium]
MTAALKVTILGCGSSGGVPRLGGADGAGEWGACDPREPKNRRRRCSILVERGATRVLVDTSPDMREQLLSARVSKLDAVLITHDHADQLHGFDDLRMIAQNMMRRVDVYAAPEAMQAVKQRFGYCFKDGERGGYPAIIEDHTIERPFRALAIGGADETISVQAFDQDHGTMVSQGFRFGPIAYSSDVVALDDAAFEAIAGVDCWIVDALRYRAHPTHAHVERTLSWIERVRPKRAILTNLHTDLDYKTLRDSVPEGVEPAFDGMTITL